MTPGERLADLLERERDGRLPDLLLFWGHTPARGQELGPWVFSQWWPAPFTVDGTTYATAEHWMMAGKARLFGDEAALARVLADPSPRAAKAHGRAVEGFDADRWEAAAYDVVVEGNLHKFSADPALRDHLLSTAPAVLVEASPSDAVWGTGLAAEDGRSRAPSAWPGRNLLGFALVEVRERLTP